MIKYTDWKRSQVAESSDVGSAIDNLVRQTTQDIVDTVKSYLDMSGIGAERSAPEEPRPAPAPSAPAPSPSAPPVPTPVAPNRGPLERLGRGADSVGRAIGNKLTPDVSAIGDRLAPRNPTLSKLVKGSGTLPQNAPMWRKVWDRVKSAADWMKKEGVELSPAAIIPLVDIQQILLESGIRPFFLVEANADFSKLARTIGNHLKMFAQGVKELSSPTASGPAPSPRDDRAPMTPVADEPAMTTRSAAKAVRGKKAAPEAPEAKAPRVVNGAEAIAVAKKAIASRAKTPVVGRWLKSMGVAADDVDGIRNLVNAVGAAFDPPVGAGLTRAWLSAIKKGEFPKSLATKLVPPTE